MKAGFERGVITDALAKARELAGQHTRADDDAAIDEIVQILERRPEALPPADKVASRRATYPCANPHCRMDFQANMADRERGWALYCCRPCKATDIARLRKLKGDR
jgi:hypothetical protein